MTEGIAAGEGPSVFGTLTHTQIFGDSNNRKELTSLSLPCHYPPEVVKRVTCVR